jgi:lysophospholipase L1-like esterase
VSLAVFEKARLLDNDASGYDFKYLNVALHLRLNIEFTNAMKLSCITAGGYALGILLLELGTMKAAPPDIFGPLFNRAATVLFQGDSITDMGRGRTDDPNHLLGHGYAFLIAANQAEAFPDRRVIFINRGVSGNTIQDLTDRWQGDTLDFRPDVLSILIGVNDVLHKLRANQPFSIEDYEAAYDKLLSDTFVAIPNAKIILGEPFFALGKATVPHIDQWPEAIKEEDEVVDKLGIKYHAAVVHYPRMFQEALKRAPVDFWIWDGIHPTYAGQQLMAYEWERTYREFYGLPGKN